MTDIITTRRLVEADIPAVLDLLRAALGEPPLLKRTPELFAWKHFDNPFGQSIALVAESSGRVVGLRAFMRWELTTPAGEVVRCVRAVDTATHPEFERRGIFRRLTEEAIEEATSDGVDLIFNTPNAKSGSGYLTMGWMEVGSIGALVRPTRWFFRGHGPDGATSASSPVDTSLIEDRRPIGLRTARTQPYLRWRFQSHPTAHYFEARVDESVAIVRSNVRAGRQELLVADLFGSHPTRALRAAGGGARAMYLASWFSAGSPERAACRRSGFVVLPGVKTLDLMARPLHELDLDIRSMASWDLALSDLELL